MAPAFGETRFLGIGGRRRKARRAGALRPMFAACLETFLDSVQVESYTRGANKKTPPLWVLQRVRELQDAPTSSDRGPSS
jgi:hypothetical protein